MQKQTGLKGSSLMDFSKPKVMGILNLTPDSFYDGGRYTHGKRALKQCAQMLEDGAAIIDIGAYSSRPGADFISQEEELVRLLPILKQVKKEFPSSVISIDTFRAPVAEIAIQEGAQIINDISGGTLDANMFTTIAHLQVPYILMHMKGDPQTMQAQTAYVEFITELYNYFENKIALLRQLGVADIIIDPGFGFAKTLEQNYELLDKLNILKSFDLPLVVGVSRKSMIYKLLEISPNDAVNGTTVLHTIALLKGANLLRVHDVKPAVEAVKLVGQITQPNFPCF